MAEKFSYSKLDTYQGCPFKYKLIYVDGHRPYDCSIAAEFGTLVHKTEETIAKCIKQNESIDYEQLKKDFLETVAKLRAKYPKEFYEKNKQGWDYDDKTSKYLEKGITRLENYLKEHPELEIIGIEQHFNVQLDNIIVHGFIDRVLHNKITDEYIVEDIKTYSAKLTAAELTVPLQFVFYSIAAKQLYNTTEDKLSFNYDLPLCNVRQQAGSKGFEGKGHKKITKLLERIDKQDFKPNPTPLCHWCPFCHTFPNQAESDKYLCPYYCKWTREKKDFSVNFQWMGMEHHKTIVESMKKRDAEIKEKKDNSEKVQKIRRILRIRK